MKKDQKKGNMKGFSKKLLAILVAALMGVMLFAGCASSTTNTETTENETAAGTENTESTETAEVTETAETAETTESTESASTDSSLDDVKAKGTLVLGMDDSFPPMGFRDENNELTGFDLDLATEVASRLGVTVEPVAIDWSQKENELNTCNIDVIWNGFTITEERKEATEMTFAYMKNRQVVVVMNDSEYQTLSDLAGKTLSLQAQSSADDALTDSPDFKASLGEVVYLNNNADALRDLEIGGCDAVLMDEVVANYYITNGSSYRVLDESLADEEYGIGCRKGSVALRDAIEETLSEMAGDGTLAEISTKWFGKDVTTVSAAN